VSRFLGYYFDSIKNKKQPSKKYSKIHFNLDCARAEAIFTKPKFKGTTEDCPVVEESFFQVSGQAERLFNIMAL
jgi:hypothetical protein